jgi:hypothetical protein
MPGMKLQDFQSIDLEMWALESRANSAVAAVY